MYVRANLIINLDSKEDEIISQDSQDRGGERIRNHSCKVEITWTQDTLKE